MVLFQRMWSCCKAQTETTLMLGLWAIVLLFFSARRESNEVGPQSCSLWAPLGLNLKWAPATETWNSVRSTGHYVNKGNVGRLCGANVITLRMKQMKHNLILRSGFLQEYRYEHSICLVLVLVLGRPDLGGKSSSGRASQPATVITLYVTFVGGLLGSK